MRDRAQGTATRERRNRDTEINEILRSGTSNTVSHSGEDLELDALGHRKPVQSTSNKGRNMTEFRNAPDKAGC